MGVPNPQMRFRYHFGPKPTKRGLKKCLLKKVKRGAVQRPPYVGGRLQDLTTLAQALLDPSGPKKGAEEIPPEKSKKGG